MAEHLGIPMENAEAVVKEQSTHVTLPYDEDGVEYALRNRRCLLC